jgi:hypothetical protein
LTTAAFDLGSQYPTLYRWVCDPPHFGNSGQSDLARCKSTLFAILREKAIEYSCLLPNTLSVYGSYQRRWEITGL